jgi:hypothetical protein
LINTVSRRQRVSSDRLKKAPVPQYLPQEFQLDSNTTGAQEDVGLTEETVVDRIMAHGFNEDGQYMVKIRWHGQYKSEVTWQEASDLPLHFIEQYRKRKNFKFQMCWEILRTYCE